MAGGDFLSEQHGRDTGPPPLRIHHILLGTVVAAVLLSLHESLRKRDALGLSMFFKSAHGIAYTLVSALNITLLGFGVWWRGRGYAFFHQPGHWLIVVNSLSMSTFLVAASAAFMGWDESQAPFLLWTAWFLGVNLAACAINYWVALRVADTLSWRSIFIVSGSVALFMVFAHLLTLYGAIYSWGYVLCGFLATLLLIFAMLHDRRSRILRDWPHWSGAGLELIMSSVAIGNYSWLLFTQDF